MAREGRRAGRVYVRAEEGKVGDSIQQGRRQFLDGKVRRV